MAIADTLQELATDISNAYDSVYNKGGTLPQNKNTNNLATAIDSISVQPPQQEALTVYVRPTSNTSTLSIDNPTGILYDTVIVASLEDNAGNLFGGMRQGSTTTMPLAYGSSPNWKYLMISNKVSVTVSQQQISVGSSGHVYSGYKAGKLYAVTLYKTPNEE